MLSLLMIDDDPVECERLTSYLTPRGFEVTSVHGGSDGLREAFGGKRDYDVMVLELMLPGMRGFEVLRQLRAGLETPILMVARSCEEMDRVTGLEMGADDFLQKPFPPRELLARLRAVLRRTHKRMVNLKPLPVVERIVVGDVELEPGSRVARCRGELLDLTSVEFGFLELLVRAAGRVVTREQLAEKILGRSLSAYDHSTYVHMSNLRKKLGAKLNGIERIKSVRGIGYLYAYPTPSMRSGMTS